MTEKDFWKFLKGLILLAYHPSKDALKALREYNQQPDKKLEIFSQIVLDEYRMWNE